MACLPTLMAFSNASRHMDVSSEGEKSPPHDFATIDIYQAY